MANNRMYLVCSLCPDKKIMLAKYYPSTNWGAWKTQQELDAFFDEHNHISQYGSGFTLEFEIEPEGFNPTNTFLVPDEPHFTSK